MDLSNVRRVIENCLREECMTDRNWTIIASAIRNAVGTTQSDIRAALQKLAAALRELARARGEPYVSIRLYSDGAVAICPHCTFTSIPALAKCYPGDDIVAAIRSLIPPPEPTPAEDLATVRRFVADRCGEGWAGAMGAIGRLGAAMEAKGE